CRLRCGVHEDGLADTGLAGHEQCSAVRADRGDEGADTLHLRLTPDQLTNLAAVASVLVMPRRVDIVHRPSAADLRIRAVCSGYVTGQERSAPPEMGSFDA